MTGHPSLNHDRGRKNKIVCLGQSNNPNMTHCFKSSIPFGGSKEFRDTLIAKSSQCALKQHGDSDFQSSAKTIHTEHPQRRKVSDYSTEYGMYNPIPFCKHYSSLKMQNCSSRFCGGNIQCIKLTKALFVHS